MSNDDRLVYGERLKDLDPAIIAIRNAPLTEADGLVGFDITLEPAVWRPFRRALMRAEGELLLEEADALLSEGFEMRTRDQLAADALLRIVEAISSGCSTTEMR